MYTVTFIDIMDVIPLLQLIIIIIIFIFFLTGNIVSNIIEGSTNENF